MNDKIPKNDHERKVWERAKIKINSISNDNNSAKNRVGHSNDAEGVKK